MNREALNSDFVGVYARNNIAQMIPGYQNASHLDAPPSVILKNEALMHSKIETLFGGRVRTIAESRHGAIYEIESNLTYCKSLVDRHHGAAFVQGSVAAGRMDKQIPLLLKVTRVHGNVPWGSWLRYRVREARMHDVVHNKLYRNGMQACMFVPAVYFAGVEHTSGMYFTFIQRPTGTLTTITNLIKHGRFTMNTYRAVESAVGAVWSTGAMVCDSSAGNILFSSRGGASIIDFDSSIVYPPEIRERLLDNIRALGMRLGKCLRVKNSTAPEFVRIWDLVMKPNNEEGLRKLKRLAIDVYGRKSWLPDANMLRVLYPIANSVSRVTGKQSIPSRRRLFAPVKKFFSPLRKDDSFEFPGLKIRRIGTVEEQWKRRDIRHSTRGHHRTNRSNVNNVVALMTAQRLAGNHNVSSVNYTTRANGNGTIAMPPHVQEIHPEVAKLIETEPNSHAMSRSIENNISNNNNRKNNAQKINNKEATEAEFIKYSTLPTARKAQILEQEVARFKASAKYDTLVNDLLSSRVDALNAQLSKTYPPGKWKTSRQATERFREKYVDEAATALVTAAIKVILNRDYADDEYRNKMYKEGIEQQLSQLAPLMQRLRQGLGLGV